MAFERTVVGMQRQRYDEAVRALGQLVSGRDDDEKMYRRDVVNREFVALVSMIEARKAAEIQDECSAHDTERYEYRLACEHEEQAGPYLQCQSCERLIEFVPSEDEDVDD